jgi:hypothetical protein
MDASKLTPEQGKRLSEAVAQMVGYTYKLAHWMQRMGWDANDPIYRSAWDAYNALHALRGHCHYASCLPETAGKRSDPPAR